MASIFLVDDDACAVGALKKLLASDGHLVCAVTCGEEAIRMIRAAKYDVVLTDLEMPTRCGREVVRAARAAHPRACIGVITAAARVSPSELLGLGACFVLSKPLDYDALGDAMRRCERCRPALRAAVRG